MSSPVGFKAPVGTRDVLPPESERWTRLLSSFAEHTSHAGYGLVQSPMFEEIGVFERVGSGTDIVTKEMYDFVDKGDRRIALRPEGTASVMRAFLQHHPVAPWKAWYAAPSFRYERPQAGRYRQHHQVGAEAIGTSDPTLDVELITVAWDFFASLGLQRVTLLLNSMGSTEDRQAYADTLTDYLNAHLGDLATEDRDKVATHPLRVLDSKRKPTAEVVRDAPRMIDALSIEARDHFDAVQQGLGRNGIPFVLEARLVRGLDYYTHTTFEFAAAALESAQNAIGGGGRYDGLAESLGGPSTPGIGFAAGIERLLLACDAEGVFGPADSLIDAFVVDITGGAAASAITTELRRHGISADRAWDNRSMKAQMKAANRSGGRVALIVGDEELEADQVTIRDLSRREDQRRIARASVVAETKALLDMPDQTDPPEPSR